MSLVRISEVAGLLKNDVTLISEWDFFYHSLQLDISNYAALRTAYLITPNAFSLLRSILAQWESENGANATIQNLANVLESTRHIAAKEALLERFSATARMSSYGRINPTYQPNPDAEQLEQARIFEDSNLQRQTSPGGISILELMPGRQVGQGRLLIFVTYLLNMLTTIGSKPVAIISINGKERSGKSFLANQFVKYLKSGNSQDDTWLDRQLPSNFQSKSGVDRVTSGIQIWHEPLTVTHNGRDCAVIIMDTQGLHDEQTGTQENAIIFGLSVLLSSVFIYNNEKQASADSLQHLRTFLEIARFASGSDNGGSQIIFQKLILLLRDWQSDNEFSFGYYDDNNCPPNQVANLKQKILGVSHRVHPESARTRTGITNCFEETAVYAMSGPGTRFPDRTQYLLSSSWEPGFRKTIVDFVKQTLSPENILNSCKRVFGQEVTAERLRPIVSSWTEHIQGTEGVLPSQTIFETTAELFFTQKIDEFLEMYRVEMNTHLASAPAGLEESELENFHSQLTSQLDDQFRRGNALGGEEMIRRYQGRLLERINGIKQDFVYLNNSNIQLEQQRLRLEHELARNTDAWNAAISSGEQRHRELLKELRFVEGKKQQSDNNWTEYNTWMNKVQSKRNFLGFSSSLGQWTHQGLCDFLLRQFSNNNQSLTAELNNAQARVQEVEGNLEDLRNSRPSSE